MTRGIKHAAFSPNG